MSLFDLRNYIRTAKLDNGEIVEYDACSKNGMNAYDIKHFRYIGHGKIHAINNIAQEGLEDYYFFRKTHQP